MSAAGTGLGPVPQPGGRWAPVLFDDDTLAQDRTTRDPVAPAKPTPHARRKKAIRRTLDGLPLPSFDSLIAELGM